MNPFPRLRLSRLLCALVALAAIGLTGCATSEYRYSTKISGGERLTFRMVNGQVDNSTVDGIKGKSPLVVPNLERKEVCYVLGLEILNGVTPRSVRVEDVSDETPLLIFEDSKPQLKDRLWGLPSTWYGFDSPEIHWVTYLGESIRVFRFTVVTGEGRQVVLYEAAVIPAFTKVMIRHMMGKDY